MRRALFLVCVIVLWEGGVAMGVEEAPFTVEQADGNFAVRRYAPHIVAETVVEGSMEDAGNAAFQPLFRYISGANRAKGKIAMTAPVGQERDGEKIAMTAPVGQTVSSNRWAVSFMMPTNYTMQTLPEPTNASVRLRAIPARRVAVVRYSGTWSGKRYERNLAALRVWMASKGLVAVSDPLWARYNPPFTPWFLRRNEILVPVRE